MNQQNHKIPIYKIICFCILLILLIFRIILKNDLSKYVTIVNYISMLLSFFNVWILLLHNTKKDRDKNICVGIFGIILVISVVIGCVIFFLDFIINEKINDIITLCALLFCISDTIFMQIIKNIFSLSFIEE